MGFVANCGLWLATRYLNQVNSKLSKQLEAEKIRATELLKIRDAMREEIEVLWDADRVLDERLKNLEMELIAHATFSATLNIAQARLKELSEIVKEKQLELDDARQEWNRRNGGEMEDEQPE